MKTALTTIAILTSTLIVAVIFNSLPDFACSMVDFGLAAKPSNYAVYCTK